MTPYKSVDRNVCCMLYLMAVWARTLAVRMNCALSITWH